jgi:hypothetical protein
MSLHLDSRKDIEVSKAILPRIESAKQANVPTFTGARFYDPR